MGIFSHKYLEDGYYEEDEMGNLIKIDINNIDEFITSLEDGKLFHSDGYTLTVVNSGLGGKNNRFDNIE